MKTSEICQHEKRRELTRASQWNGLDYVEVSEDQKALTVYFLGKAPKSITAANVRIEGGRRIRNVKVSRVVVHQVKDPTEDDSMEVTVDQPGDFSTYTLRLQDDPKNPEDHLLDQFDRRYTAVDFSFKASCPSDLDCRQEAVCPPEKRMEPEINYLAKDYASFRQLILDRLALLMPDWQERHVPDLGITLVELLAYVGDHLSYYQDAVATEAYLGTARQRISVRRHARLVDYFLHEGCNARAWVTIDTNQNLTDERIRLREVYFTTGSDISPGEIFEPLVNDPDEPLRLYEAHSTLHFYTWGDAECCLPRGATSATLKDEWAEEEQKKPSEKPPHEQHGNGNGKKPPATDDKKKRLRKLHLEVGDVLILEEIIGPKTGNAADADPTRRWAVRLTRVTPIEDPVTEDGHPVPVVEIEWATKDALPFPFCLSARRPAPHCDLVTGISVARGNVFLVAYGKTLAREDLGVVETETVVRECACDGSAIDVIHVPAQFRPVLSKSGLAFGEPLAMDPLSPASVMLKQDPRKALPRIDLRSIPPAPGGGSSLFALEDLQDPVPLARKLRHPVDPADAAAQSLRSRLTDETREALDDWDGTSAPPPELLNSLQKGLEALLEPWTVQQDLLSSGPNDRDFVVEIDNEGRAHLRFGDGAMGQQPEAGSRFIATYRVGNGPAGNVGADAITRIGFRNTSLSGASLRPRNPLPAQGGTVPEPMAEAKMFAPGAFRKELQRAITAEDYARLAERDHPIQRAGSALSWTGSWYEARVVVDPFGVQTADEASFRSIKGRLFRYRRIGHDLSVNLARYVPLEIELAVCVLPHFLRGHVEAALLDIFSNRALPDGRLGLFHPDRLTFGEGVYLSQLVAAAQAVTGVESVTVKKLQRLFEGDNGERDAGVLKLGPLEIAQLDNDPSFPEHGTLKLNLGGGR